MCYEITYEREVTYNGSRRITKLITPPKRPKKLITKLL
jgi:hypothetical protein